jgi:5-oxopent-3-ene-1,2,5-tricarboxylate decarboxylase/2-hydroxyhepta-2,4-diene-1,7-dioate isomerase
MKHVRFAMEGRIVSGIVEKDKILDESRRQIALNKIPVWLSPVEAHNIIALGPNSKEYISKLDMEIPNQPILYHKYNHTLIGHKAPVYYPEGLEKMECEGQLAVIIGRVGRNISSENAMDYVQGFSIAHDITGKDFLSSFFRPPIRAKEQDTFGSVGPYLVDKEDVANIQNLSVKTYVNGELRIEGNTGDLVFGICNLIEYISSFMTLQPSDMLWTGTPGVPISITIGDVVCTEIENIGMLENVVIKDRIKK